MSAVSGRWAQSLLVYRHPRVIAMSFLGFSSGLTFPLVLTTLSARLRQSGIDRTTIGYFSLVGLAYSLKYFWSPLVDRTRLPFLWRLGRRRSWMLFAQCGIAGGLVLMAFGQPAVNPVHFAWLAVITAFAAATQDISIDAYRIEAVDNEHQGAMAATYQVGYQIALITGGAGALASAASFGWTDAYLIMASCVAVGIFTTLVIAEPERRIDRATLSQEQRVTNFLSRSKNWPDMPRNVVAWLIGAVVCPFVDFFSRFGLRLGVPLLLLIVAYRMNYVTMGVAANTYYLDLGFTLDQIALVSKIYGIVMTLTGALLAGILVKRLGVARVLLIGWALLTVANLLYAYIANISPGMGWFAVTVSVDNIANGIAGTAFIAFMSSLTNTAYTATQYALFGTLWSLPAKAIASQWGWIVDAWGYRPFFVYSAAIGIPALFFIVWLLRHPEFESIPRNAAPQSDGNAVTQTT